MHEEILPYDSPQRARRTPRFKGVLGDAGRWHVLLDRGLIHEERHIMETHVTPKGRIVIPAVLRRKYGIKRGHENYHH